MNNNKLIIFINLMFLLMGLLVSIMSVLIPEIIRSFQISYGLASLLPFTFYIALLILTIKLIKIQDETYYLYSH